jgi:hypothetical protein
MPQDHDTTKRLEEIKIANGYVTTMGFGLILGGAIALLSPALAIIGGIALVFLVAFVEAKQEREAARDE